ncbi:MAG: trypsin-like peptidase domain-containing protein [Flavobacteriales bacterium]|jgi:Do/DeqQ family serine protease|nr:trypsin-like peptidase domain-containing protein [Flavobacteriales bacterium]
MSHKISGFFSAILGAAIALGAYHFFFHSNEVVLIQDSNSAADTRMVSMPNAAPELMAPDFVAASETSLPAVVHVRTFIKGQSYSTGSPLLDLFYGHPGNRPPSEGAGSGVIISQDGYIVTNNHVIDKAQQIEITLNNRKSYSAKLIGKDPATDLALLKIDQIDLPFLAYGNSDQVRVGEWVLAVGNPFNLNSTVTAGIISAKGRDINILKGDPQVGAAAVESFLQTDAAVNPGNSGGALVNTKGELIGINAAIKSNTGSFTGYSFAIPSNIVRKVVEDLIEFGSVQRAFIGVSIQNVSNEIAADLKLDDLKGVYVAGLSDNGSARDAGIEVGDIIKKINGKEVKDVPGLQENLSKFRPGEKVVVSVLRKNSLKDFAVVLKNKFGNTELVNEKNSASLELLGARFESPSDENKNRLRLKSGLQIIHLKPGKLLSAGIREGFIVTAIDGNEVNSIDDINRALEGKKGGVLIEGIYPNGRMAYYGIGI